MLKSKKKINVLQFAYGEMAEHVFTSLFNHDEINSVGIITPSSESQHYRNTLKTTVEALAERNNIPIYQTGDLKEIHEIISQVKPDLVVIATFMKILPNETLTLTKFVNIHIGRLPRQRGRANVNWAIINKEISLSVSVHEAIPELDAGNIIRQFHVPIKTLDTVGDVYKKINSELEQNISDLLVSYYFDKIQPQPQDQNNATYYCTRIPEDGLIDWTGSRKNILNIVRSLTSPYPGAYTYLNNKKLLIWSVQIPEFDRKFEGIIPGRVAKITKDIGVEVLTADGPVLLTDVEFMGERSEPSKFIKSTKTTLGINFQLLIEQFYNSRI